jgi:hypothetical protein
MKAMTRQPFNLVWRRDRRVSQWCRDKPPALTALRSEDPVEDEGEP